MVCPGQMKKSESQFNIAAVERDVGLSKDVLRVWERRYGFPSPARDARGERLYPAEQVRRLRLVKRLMDRGMRPGRLLGSNLEELETLEQELGAPASPTDSGGDADTSVELLACLRAHGAPGLYRSLQQQLAKVGLARFVQDTMAPLAVRVGEEWARGGLEIYEEHLFTEVAMRLMRRAIAAVPPGREPVVLLTTVPDEPHGLGLMMVESVLCLHGARCISLGTQVPPSDITRAAQVYLADVVALSFSAAFAARRVPGLLLQMRASLPPRVQLWAGGAAVRRVSAPEGVQLLVSLDDVACAVQAWSTRGEDAERSVPIAMERASQVEAVLTPDEKNRRTTGIAGANAGSPGYGELLHAIEPSSASTAHGHAGVATGRQAPVYRVFRR